MVLVVPVGKLPVKPRLEYRQCLETSQALQLCNSCDIEHVTAVQDHVFDGVELETPQGLRCGLEVPRKHCSFFDEEGVDTVEDSRASASTCLQVAIMAVSGRFPLSAARSPEAWKFRGLPARRIC